MHLRPQIAHTLSAHVIFFLYLKNVLVLTNILRPIVFEIISLLMLIGREDYENKNTDK